MNNNEKYKQLRKEYPDFIFESYSIAESTEGFNITYHFSIPNLVEFHPVIKVPKKGAKLIDEFTKNLVFHIGLVELISYWKSTCSPNIIIKAGFLNQEQLNWFKKLYYYGLGELFFVNKIENDIDDFVDIKCEAEAIFIPKPDYNGVGCMIPIGGGKDSNVTLELLKNDYANNDCFIINPKPVIIECAKIGGYSDEKTLIVERIIDKQLIDLNNKSFINGHTPFSALIAFVSYLTAYLNNKKYIVLSNEASANEETVIGTDVNHQYSKTYEFENDFYNYTNKYFAIDIKYFSLLRPLSEFQIAMLFSDYEKYHLAFKSCNVGSKKNPWNWCCNCPKCLFVFIILSPFLYKDKLEEIFGEDLYQKEELLKVFIELTGRASTKPFECVGTYSEVRYAITLVIDKLLKNDQDLPYLLKYYQENYELSDLDNNLKLHYNDINNLEPYFESLIKGELSKYV